MNAWHSIHFLMVIFITWFIYLGTDEDTVTNKIKIKTEFDKNIKEVNKAIPVEKYPILNELIIGMTKWDINERFSLKTIIEKLN